MNLVKRRTFLSTLAVASAEMSAFGSSSLIGFPKRPIRIGIIGLDTSQVTMIISHIKNIPGPSYDVVQPS
jgi:hypothetical protein